MATHQINSNCVGTGCANLDCGSCGICQVDTNGNGTCVEDTGNPCDCVFNALFGTWNCETTGGCTGTDIDVSVAVSGCEVIVAVECGDCCGSPDIEIEVTITPDGGGGGLFYTDVINCASNNNSVLYELIGTTGQIFVSAQAASGSSIGSCNLNIDSTNAYSC